MAKRQNPTKPKQYDDPDGKRPAPKSVDPSNPAAPNLREPPKRKPRRGY